MNDMIIRAAQDPSCILAVTPDRGGSWWATLRPDTPRNFAENPMTWTEFSPDKITINTQHDYEFLIQFSSSGQLPLTDNETQLFYNTDNKMLAGVWIAKDGQIRGYMSVYEYNALMIHEIGEPALSAGIHAIRILAVGDTMSAYLDDELANSAVRNRRTDFSEITSYPISSFDGNILCAKLTDLTTGETVWQASHDELYETNYPWPSAVPRNFAEEPTAFYDCQSICSEKIDPSHDYRFLFDSEIVSDKIECSMFYAGAAGFPFGIYCHPTNQINCFTNMFRVSSSPSSQYTNTSVYNGESRLQGRHVIEMEIAGNSLKTYLDGVLINRPSGFVRTGVAPCDLPQCNSGYVYKIQIKDLTTGKTVWSYPSEAERVRLLTKTNVRTDRGVFEAADTSKRWSVTTQLRAAALIPECTIIVEADNPGGEIVSYVSCAQLLNPSQGFFVIRKNDAGALLFGYSGKNSSGAMVYPNRYIEYPDGKHVFAFVLDYSALQLRIYIDGAEVDNRAMDVNVVAPPEFDETVKPVILGVTSTSDGLNLTSKISHCLIFDRALTAAEIAAFGVRRPRNFAEKTMTWTEFSPDKITINTQHDYEFLIQFSSNGQLPPTDSETQLFYSTDNKMLAGVWIAKDGQIRGYLSVYEYNALMIHEIGEPALSAGIHTIRILAVGNTMSAYLDDELMNSAVRNRRTDFSEITSYPISSFDGNLLCAKLTDLTTGENVWRANHNDLFTY